MRSAKAGEVPYIVSEFVEGPTLADLLTRGRPPVREAAALVAAVAEALDEAHRRGVVHRDIKPSNIMIRPDGSPAVLDFGLAKREAGEVTMTLEGQVLGTPAYMSPEQARGEGHRVDGRSDVYSLGVVLYQLITGELPFRGNQRMLLHQVLHDEPRPPRKLDDRIPRDLETIALKAIAKEPSRRYGSARELADDLGRFRDGRPIAARPVGPAGHLWLWCRRHPYRAAAVFLGGQLLLAVLLLSVAVSVLQTQLARKSRDAQKDLEAALGLVRGQRDAADRQRRSAELRTAELALERGQALAGGGDPSRGLLWMARALAFAPSDDEALQRTIRANLAAWAGQVRWRTLRKPPNGTMGDSLPPYVDPLPPRWSSPEGLHGVIFRRDGRALLCWGEDGARLVDLAAGLPPSATFAAGTRLLGGAFSPNGKLVLTAGSHGGRIWDAATGLPLSPRLTHPAWPPHTGAFSPDGSIVVTQSILPYAQPGIWAKLWTSPDGRPYEHPLNRQPSVYQVAFSPDGTKVAAAVFDGTARIYALRGGLGWRYTYIWLGDATADPSIESVLPSIYAEGSTALKTISMSCSGKASLDTPIRLLAH